MSFLPISGIPPQYDLHPGFFLGFEASGTSTTINMYTDSTGGTALIRSLVDSEGYFVTGASARFVPHIDQGYKISLYPTLTDSQNKTNAEWTIDGLSPVGNLADETNINFETVADMVADTFLVVGNFVSVEDYATGRNSGVLFFKVVGPTTGTADGGSFIDLTGSGFQAQQNFQEFRATKQFGAVVDSTTSGSGADDTVAVEATYAAAGAAGVPFVLSAGFSRFTSQMVWGLEIDVRGSGRFKCGLVKDGTFDGVQIFDSEGSQYSDFSVYGATSNTGLGIEIDLGHRITMSEVGIFNNVGGLIMRGGNQAGFYNLKITSNTGGTGLEIASGTGSIPGASANSGTYVNLDLNGNDINFKISKGATNRCLNVICQNATTMNAQLVNVADVERNKVELYTEFEGTSTSDIGGVANDITIIQGEVTDSGTNNRILDFNQAGTEKPQYRKLFFAKSIIQDRDADAVNSQPWEMFENATSLLRILRLHSLGSDALPALIDISQPSGNVCDIDLAGAMRPQGIIPTSVGTRTGSDTTPSVAGVNALLLEGIGTISDLLEGIVGQTVTLKSTVDVSIVHATSIQLKGSINFVMEDGDTLTVKLMETGEWSEIGRMEV